MTTPDSTGLLEPDVELALIRWRQKSFNRITETVEDALPNLMAEIERTVAELSAVAAGKAQMWPDKVWKAIYEPWAQKTASQVEMAMVDSIDTIATSLSEGGNGRKAFQLLLPTLAQAGVLAASLAAIPTVIALATASTTTLLVFTSTTFLWPVFAVGGATLAVATFAGSRLADRISDRNRKKLVVSLQDRSRTAALGHGLAAGARCLVTDLQATALRGLEAKLETI